MISNNLRVLYLLLFTILCHLNFIFGADQPNIIFVLVDDLGWNDVSFHGSGQIPTPNIDALAFNGIIFNNHYVQPTGTSTRAALMTGKYPIHLGMQGPSFGPADTRALPEGKLFSHYFKNMGYSTHLVGKWGLGYSKWNETPIFRGFDHHFGYYNSFTSYYDYVSTYKINDVEYSGFDLRKDMETYWEGAGKYATDLFTEYVTDTIKNHDYTKPLFILLSHLGVHSANEGKYLEAPQEIINKFKHINDPNRRTYAAMVSKLDASIGEIVKTLEEKGVLKNTIIVLTSDNGAPTEGPSRNWGSNYPLKDIKGSLFEGGIRSVALIYSPLIVQPNRISTDLIHITDWLPTLYSACNGDIELLDTDLDGIDQWSSLVYDLPSPRNEILINIDEATRYAALRFYNWKLIVGSNNNSTPKYYYSDPTKDDIEQIPYKLSEIDESPAGKAIKKLNFNPLSELEYEALRNTATLKCFNPNTKKSECDPSSGQICLYDIPSDPCEENNLSGFFPSVVRRMKRALVEHRKGLIPQIEGSVDIEGANPNLFNHIWSPWINCTEC